MDEPQKPLPRHSRRSCLIASGMRRRGTVWPSGECCGLENVPPSGHMRLASFLPAAVLAVSPEIPPSA